MLTPQEQRDAIVGCDRPQYAYEVTAEGLARINDELVTLREQVRLLRAKLEKVQSWLVRLAEHDEREAKVTRFETMREAYTADAKNYRATVKDIAAALYATEDHTP